MFCWRKLEPGLLQTNQHAAADLGPLQHCIALHCIALHCIACSVKWCAGLAWKKGLQSLTLHQREEEVEKGKLYNNTFNGQRIFIIVTSSRVSNECCSIRIQNNNFSNPTVSRCAQFVMFLFFSYFYFSNPMTMTVVRFAQFTVSFLF